MHLEKIRDGLNHSEFNFLCFLAMDGKGLPFDCGALPVLHLGCLLFQGEEFTRFFRERGRGQSDGFSTLLGTALFRMLLRNLVANHRTTEPTLGR